MVSPIDPRGQTRVDVSVGVNGPIKGFILEGHSGLTKLRLSVGRGVLIDLDRTYMRLLTQTVGNLLWFPLRQGAKMFSWDVQDYRGCINPDRMSSRALRLQLEFSEVPKDLRLHTIVANWLESTVNEDGSTVHKLRFDEARMTVSRYRPMSPSRCHCCSGANWHWDAPVQRDTTESCAIDLGPISESTVYTTCEVCSATFSLENIKKTMERDKDCPVCRTPWTNHQTYTVAPVP